MSKKLNIRPTTSVYATYKNIRYNPWTAIAEFVDNSTQSYYDNVNKLKDTKYWDGLYVDIYFEKDTITNKETLVIKDNAYGMDYADFKRAVILDSPPKKSTRSEFGMGLKTAACWFGTNWSVETVELGSGIKYKTEIDVEALHKYKNEEIDVVEDSCSKKEHGTVIRIWNLNHNIKGKQVQKTKDQLRGMYRCDLREGNIHISYNNESLFYEDPEILIEELPDGNNKEWKQSINFDLTNEGKKYHVEGFAALRKTGSTSAAGFTLLRRGRVIVGGYENCWRPEEIFERSNSFVYQRLFGELNLDDWPVTQTKDDFVWFSGLEEKLIDKLLLECKELKIKAQNYRVREKINVASKIKQITADFEKAGVIDDTSIDINDSVEDGVNEKHANERNDHQNINIQNRTHQVHFKFGGTNKYTLDYKIADEEPGLNWLTVRRDKQEQDRYTVILNISHPFFEPYLNDANFIYLMEKFAFALVLAELEARDSVVDGSKVDPSSIRKKMNETLNFVSEGSDVYEG